MHEEIKIQLNEDSSDQGAAGRNTEHVIQSLKFGIGIKW